ncbi:ArnT family glycosyltransferase [Pendulispora albinea]|uniref:Glycosyltransferase family 39 protein n=1 Tax=Pendulispora albinea TaxID=2741071 RepID=A0ABZ2LXA6_9BACT
MSSSPSREERRPTLLATALVLFAVAFVPRILVAHFLAGEPVWDGHYYDFGARRIAQGLGYSDDVRVAGALVWHPWCHYPVGYSGFLGFFYFVLGDAPWVSQLVNAIVSSLLPVFTWMLARRGLSEGRARLAGALCAVHPGLVLYSALVMTEPLAALATLMAFWLTVRDPRPVRGILAGALMLGLGALVRPQALLVAPFLALRVVDRDAPPRLFAWLRRVLPWAVAACAVALLPVLPWTARNCRVMDGCALVSTNAGWNLAIGAFPRATGRFETLRSSDGCREVTGQVQQDRCWFAYGVEQIRSHPLHWLALVPAKLGYTFDQESFPVEYLHEARPQDWPEPRRADLRGVLTAVHRFLLVASLLGCIAFTPTFGRRGARRLAGIRGGKRAVFAQGLLATAVVVFAYAAIALPTPSFWPLAVAIAILPWLPIPGRPAWPSALLLPVALLATTALAHAVFFGEDRYHMVATPVLCILVAAGLRRPAAV